jgi:hypothetical protein
MSEAGWGATVLTLEVRNCSSKKLPGEVIGSPGRIRLNRLEEDYSVPSQMLLDRSGIESTMESGRNAGPKNADTLGRRRPSWK